MGLEQTSRTVADVIRALPRPEGRRLVVALAGAPASGKSTLAQALVDRLSAAGEAAQLVAMDGFHLDNAILDARGMQARKGAPETFDVAGLARLVGALRSRDEVVVPAFDRARDVSINCAAVVPPSCDIVVVEGNYLLLDEPGWRDLAALWDFSVWLEVPQDELRVRLLRRWRAYGEAEGAALARAEGNDLPNARRVSMNSIAADLTVGNSEAGSSK